MIRWPALHNLPHYSASLVRRVARPIHVASDMSRDYVDDLPQGRVCFLQRKNSTKMYFLYIPLFCTDSIENCILVNPTLRA